MSDDEVQTLVIDNGSLYTKVGFAGDDAPTGLFETVISGGTVGDDSRGRGVRPIQEGQIVGWDGIEEIWRHAFENELRVDPTQCAVMITQSPLNSESHVEKITQIMFETFSVPALQIIDKPTLCMYASGRTEGLSVYSGDGLTVTAPIYQGYAISHACNSSIVAGGMLTAYLQSVLAVI